MKKKIKMKNEDKKNFILSIFVILSAVLILHNFIFIDSSIANTENEFFELAQLKESQNSSLFLIIGIFVLTILIAFIIYVKKHIWSIE